MKKTLWLALILLLVCVSAFSACDSGDTPQTPNDTASGTTDKTTESETDTHVHAFCEWTTVKDATCTVKGEQERSCSCGEKETQSIDVTGHTEVIDAAVAATCTTDGKTEGKHCSVCNETLIAQNNIPASHKESNFIVDVPATIYADGTQHTYCTVCDTEIQTNVAIPRITSVGLAYEVNADKTTCTIKGIGACTDTEIGIPDFIDTYKVTAIGENAFGDCSSVTAIVLSNNIQTIGNRAFYKTALSEISIPSSVNKIGNQIFLGCESLATVYYNSSYAPPEGGTFIKNEAIKKIVFGEYLTTIPNYICYNCDNLKEIILSPNTKYIGSYAFYYCTSVKQIDLPEGLLNTGWYAFYGMSITEIIIPNTVETIINSFRACEKLESIVLPVSVISVPRQTFYLCGSIKEVYYMGGELEWSSISISEESDTLKRATVYFYSENQPGDTGNYWHCVDGVATPWQNN